MVMIHNLNTKRGVTVIHSHQTGKSLELNPGINKVSDEDMAIFGEKIKAIANLRVVEKLTDSVPAGPVEVVNNEDEAEAEAKAKADAAEAKAKLEADEAKVAKEKAEAEAKAKADADKKAAEAKAKAELEAKNKK